LALFASKVATKITAAMTIMPKTEPTQIKARRFRLVIAQLLTFAQGQSIAAAKDYFCCKRRTVNYFGKIQKMTAAYKRIPKE
jgi:hypothetical protein